MRLALSLEPVMPPCVKSLLVAATLTLLVACDLPSHARNQYPQRQQALAMHAAGQKKPEHQKLAAHPQRNTEEEKLKAQQQVVVQRLAILRRQFDRETPDGDLKYLRELTAGSGTLLVFLREQSRPVPMPNEGFLYESKFEDWYVFQKDEFQPLSIAYINETGRIGRLENVAVYGKTAQIQNKQRKSRYVLAAPHGWFDKHGIKEGDVVSFKTLTAKRRDELYARGRKEVDALLARYNSEDKQMRIAMARQTGLDVGSLLQAGKAWHHGYQCLNGEKVYGSYPAKEEGQSLFYVQSREADGSITAIYDLLVADFDNKVVHNARVQMRGRKEDDGAYTFTPIKTLKSASGYKVNSIRVWGKLDELDVNLSGSKCGTAEQVPILVKESDHIDQWSAGVKFNLAHRSLQMAEIFYGETPDPEGKLEQRPLKNEPGLGMVLIVAGPSLPGETAKTSHAVWITDYDNAASRSREKQQAKDSHRVSSSSPYYGKWHNYYADMEIKQNCADMRSTFPCVGNVRRNKNLRESARTNRHYVDLFSIQAAHSRKVVYTPDFAPQHELFWYEILPGQKINSNLKNKQEIAGNNYYSPDDNESVVRFGYRYPRYAYFHALARRTDQARKFQQHYTVKREDLKVKRGGKVSNHNPISFSPSATQIYQGCADYTYTMSIKPKNAANRKPFDLNLLFALEQTGEVRGVGRDGKSHTGTYTTSSYARKYVTLNAKNNYTQTFPVTFKCVVEAEESTTQHNSWFYSIPTGTSTSTTRLKGVKFKTVFGGVYE